MDDTAEKWDRQAEKYQEAYIDGPNEYNAQLVDFLGELGGLGPGKRVLDIGCGVGKYGAMFAKMGCEVTLTDISPEMLRLAENNLSGAGGSWRTVCGDWKNVPVDGPAFREKFDLAISTMSPGVRDAETAAKMSAVTDGWCFLARFRSWDAPLENGLIRELGLPEKPRFRRLEADCADMELFVRKAGFAPQIRLVPYDWQDNRTPEDCAARFADRYFEGSADTDIKNAVLRAAEKMADSEGVLTDAVHTTVEWIYWNTKERRR